MSWCLNIRGCNGSGKTSLVREFINADENTLELKRGWLGNKPAFTFCPLHNLVIIGGNYTRCKCGGADTLVKEQIVKLIGEAWKTDSNILFEGVLVSDSKIPYYEYMKALNSIKTRHWGFAYLDIPLQICLDRVYSRNGGKKIDEEAVAKKHKNSIRYRKWHIEQGDCLVYVLDGTQSIKDIYTKLKDKLNKLGE